MTGRWVAGRWEGECQTSTVEDQACGRWIPLGWDEQVGGGSPGDLGKRDAKRGCGEVKPRDTSPGGGVRGPESDHYLACVTALQDVCREHRCACSVKLDLTVLDVAVPTGASARQP